MGVGGALLPGSLPGACPACSLLWPRSTCSGGIALTGLALLILVVNPGTVSHVCLQVSLRGSASVVVSSSQETLVCVKVKKVKQCRVSWAL